MDEEDEFDLATILGRRAGGGRAGHSAEAAASSGLADSEDFLAQLQQDDGGDTQQAAETRLGRLCRQLRRAWFNEKIAPEILPFEAEAVAEIQRAVVAQEESAKEGAQTSDATHRFMYHLYQMELARLRYLLTSYLRIRLWKVEKQALYIVQQGAAVVDNLSSAEAVYVRKYERLVREHQRTSFLSRLHEMAYVQKDNEGRELPAIPDQITPPNLDAHVFAKFHEAIDQVDVGAEDDGQRETVRVAQDDIWIMRYRTLEPYVRNGRAHFV